VGGGRKNTLLILAVDENAPAAKACDSYINGGKTDWFLPSKDELNEMYKQKNLFTNFGTGNVSARYCSSSQYDYMDAWYQTFNDGQQSSISKTFVSSVRAIRAF